MSAIQKGNTWNEHSFKEVEDYVTERLDSIEDRLNELDWCDALTIEATEDNTSLAWWLPDNQEILDDHSVTIQVSRDGGRTWTNVQSGDPRNVNYNIGTLNAGEKVIVKGNGPTGFVDQGGDYGNYFFANKPCYVYGNVMSLLYGADYASRKGISDPSALAYLFAGNDGSSTTWVLSKPQYPIILPATTLANSCYEGMFNGCTSLAAAPALPATTLAENCYYRMFYNCTSLTTAPALPATTLADFCYVNMFYNCTSLTAAPALPATTLANSCYVNMFYGCTALASAPELPATTLQQSSYANMFSGCTALTTAPELPATSLANNCYSNMFKGCTSLTAAPELPAATLGTRCYVSMFSGCTSLATAPELPATTLAGSCYQQMFQGCTSLASVKCLASAVSPYSAVSNWLYNVSATGTFTKAAGVTWPEGASGIPSGWTVVEASS